jgi:hypothetical protein
VSELFGIPGQIRDILAVVNQINVKVDQIMSQDQTIAAEAADEATDIANLTTAVDAMQALIVALQGETGLSPATLAAAAAVQTSLDALTATAQGDVTTDTPPPASTTPPAS